MKISVLTVCRNAARTLPATLASFFAQDHDDKELIVVDGASTDNTAEVVARHRSPRLRFVSEPDRGMYDALNKGLRLAAGEAIGILNADDTYHDRHALGRIADALEASDIVFGHLDFVVDHEQKGVVRRWRGRQRPAEGFRTGWMPAHPTFYVRRRVAETVGEFDLSFRIAADYDWMLRAVELHGFRTSLIDAVLVDMMVGGISTGSMLAHLRHNREALASRRRWLGAGLIDYAAVAKPLRKIGQLRPIARPVFAGPAREVVAK